MSAICLIRPPVVDAFRLASASITPPLGFSYIVAAIEATGREVCVIDAVGAAPDLKTRFYKGYIVGLRLDDIARRIPTDASAVGLGAMFTHEWPLAVRLIQLIKQKRPELPIILGSEHVTAMPEFSLLTSEADYLVLGEGEETVAELLDALEGERPLDGIDGIAYRDGDAIRVNKRRQRRRDLDAITWPAWHRIDLETYHAHRYIGGMYSEHLTIPILATRGCPFQCTFCASPTMWTPLWIPRDPACVADEIEHYVNTFGARNFPFQDLTAIIQKDWVLRFCDELIKRDLDITWQLPSGTRCEAVDAETSAKLKRSGMLNMAYAPESGSPTTRRFVKKKLKDARLFQSIDDAVAAGLNITTFFIVGFPHDEPEHLAESLPFIDRLAAHGVTDLSVGFYIALPGTELFHSLYDAGKIRLDQDYFKHFLFILSLMPARSYAPALSRLHLAYWKLRWVFRFYGAERSGGEGAGIFRWLLSGVAGLFGSKTHSSKFQTAMRNGLGTLWTTFICQFGTRWMPVSEERAMFADWDRIYREIRTDKIKRGQVQATPADPKELHLENVIGQRAGEFAGGVYGAD